MSMREDKIQRVYQSYVDLRLKRSNRHERIRDGQRWRVSTQINKWAYE